MQHKPRPAKPFQPTGTIEERIDQLVVHANNLSAGLFAANRSIVALTQAIADQPGIDVERLRLDFIDRLANISAQTGQEPQSDLGGALAYYLGQHPRSP